MTEGFLPHNQAESLDFAALWTAHDLGARTHHLDVHATLQPPASPDDALLAMRVASLPKLTKAGEEAPPELALGSTIGEGGMGVVRAARQLALGREVAVKSLRPEQVTPESIRKLLHEALITGSLEHPDIIPVYALGQSDDGAPMMVMKRVEGTAWTQVLRDPHHPLLEGDPRERLVWHLEVLMRVCQAMAYAHGKGILHRDLKTDNVMIGRFGEVYVLDWGIAVALRDDHSGALPLAVDAKTVAGTPSCMAPEMVEGDGAQLSVHSDVFLLGAILHQILTGKPRFSGASVYDTMFAAYACEPYAYPPEVPEELAAICQKATARDPADRYQTTAQLRLALATYLQHRTSMRLLTSARERRLEMETHLHLAQTLLLEKNHDPHVLEEVETALTSAFAEARLALREALRSWADNEPARLELQNLLTAFIDFQLQIGDVKGAVLHVAELPLADADLHARVEHERAQAEKRAQELAKLQQDFDPRVGARTRSFLALVLAVVWSVLPLAFDWFHKTKGVQPTGAGHVATTGLFAAFMAFAAIWARESLFRSQLNRTVVASGMVAVLGVFLTRVVCWYCGIPFAVTLVLDMVVIGVVLAMMAANQWRRLFVPAAVYFSGAAVAMLLPDTGLVAIAVANLVAMCLVAFAWRPADYDECALVMTAAMPVDEALERGRKHLRAKRR